MFWKKKKEGIPMKIKKELLEELRVMRNKTVMVMKDIDSMSKKIEELK
tara:strand:+ start:16490 stop:16633 length:144 start_codon:yes stop_codon:yes gene_type:complete